MISERLRNAIKTASERQYRLAQRIRVHPTTLSAWVNGIFPVHRGDPRVLQLGALLGVPAAECFDEDDSLAAVNATIPNHRRCRSRRRTSSPGTGTPASHSSK